MSPASRPPANPCAAAAPAPALGHGPAGQPTRSLRRPLAAQPEHPALPAVVMLAVLGIVLATYWPALSASALYMDDKFYVGAPLMRHPSWASVRTIFGEVFNPSLVNGYYQPLSLLSVMLDFLDPRAASSLLPFHRTSLLLHLLNVALVVTWLYVLFGNWRAAGLLGLLYGLHPLNADAVLWVAERKTVLSASFALSSLLLYVSHARRAELTRHGDWRRYGASLLLYVCAVLAKPTAMPLFALLLILDYWPLERRGRAVLLEKVPFLIVASLSAVVTIISQSKAGHAGMTEVMNPAHLPLVIGYATGLYLSKMVYPTGLVSDYAAPTPFGLTNGEVLGNVLGATVLLAALLLSRRRTRAFLAGGLFFLVAVVPTVGIIRFTASVAANRFVYLPMVGLLLPLAWGLGRLWKADLGALTRSSVRLLLAGVGATLVIGGASATRSYASHWRDTPTLLQHFLTQSPGDWKLHTRLGNEWIQRGDYPSAIAEFRQATQLNPGWTENQLNLGRALFTVGAYPQAERAFAIALRQTPNDWRAHMLMGMTRTRQQDLEGALQRFRTAAGLAPTQAAPRHKVAETLVELGRRDEAAAEYRRVLRLDPKDRQARRALEAIPSGDSASQP